MAVKALPSGWVVEIKDRRRLRSGGKSITDLFIEYAKPDRVWLHYTGEDGVQIGEIYVPADPDTLDDLAKGIKAVAKAIREDWLKRSGTTDSAYKAPALGGDLNYESE
ncbi:hypothetical protein [Methylobacterium sp. Leaf113]|uniref:hypothetical protein n=1 Tax=Methylobacterium sp. Leaf113 TaxID=1736259 RepID=UPI000A6C273E|nr:hypothetical protein [Methylobacterium sp. Leaf113]